MRTLAAVFLSMVFSIISGFSETPVSEAPSSSNISIPSSTAKIFTLENGLTVVVDEDHSAPVASVQAWCQTGSIHEGKWLGAGLSHILEHMLFKGTEKRTRGEIDKAIQARGGYVNAYTAFDRTVYWVDIPAAGAYEALDVLADAMMNSTLPADEYTKEQEVIRREFAMGFDDPNRQNYQLMFRTVFSESPYRHPIIGYLDVYNKLTRDDVMAYYKARYVPNNLFFVVTGDVDAAKIKEQLETFFAKYPRRALEPVFVPEEPEQVGRRDAHEEFATELSRLNLAWQIPSVTHPDMAPLDVLGTVLGGGASSPLYQQIREKKGLAHSISAGAFALQNAGVFAIMAICDPEQRNAVEKEALAMVDEIKQNGVSASELEKAKKSLLASQLSQLTTARGKASDDGSNWLLTRNLNFSKDYLDAINRVTSDDLQRVAGKYLREDTVNVSSLNPIGTLSKTDEAVASLAASEVQKFELPNGLRLLVRENHRLPLVSMVAAFRGGLLAETPTNNGISQLFASTLIKGTKTRSAEQIADTIESVGGSVDSSAGNNSYQVAVEVMKPDLELGIDLLADILQNPTFPENEVAREKEVQLASIKAEEDQPTTIARNLLRKNLFPGHPYGFRANGTPETVSKLSAADLRAFHEANTVGKNGVIAVFGDVQAQEVYERFSKALAALPAGQDLLTKLPQPRFPAKSGAFTDERKKQQAIVMVGFPGVDLKSPDRLAMEVLDSASSDMGSRFFDRIREQHGLAYFVSSSQLIGPVAGMLFFYLGTDPAKLEKARTELGDEIAKVAKEGLTQEEVDRAKQKLLGAEAIRNQSDRVMAQAIALDELFGLGADYAQKRKAQLEAIQLPDINRVVEKYLSKPSIEAIVVPPRTSEAAKQQ